MKLAFLCDSGAFLEQAIRDRLIAGLHSDAIRSRRLVTASSPRSASAIQLPPWRWPRTPLNSRPTEVAYTGRANQWRRAGAHKVWQVAAMVLATLQRLRRNGLTVIDAVDNTHL
ncbi:hypothetical protein HPB50_014285 [Hyalomma asiaticum]|uniref:Uncharacterized protein n=1 Tax=Hyalomma asiaticum TaxID=266040 RepID=A0ACB7THX0_HYAAI|nr:hypothetical protein HPB50_014285 [Hyalomma asiaticum]